MKPHLSKNHIESNAAKSRQMPHGNIVHRLSVDPFLDWAIILIVSFCTALVLVALGVSMYLDTRAELSAPAPVPSGGHGALISADAIQAALKGFDDKAKLRSALEKSHSVPRDPSLP